MAKKRTSIWFKLGVGFVVLVASLLTLLYALRAAYSNRIMPGVYGNGIYVGGLTRDEATKLLGEEAEKYKQTSVDIKAGSASQNYPAQQFVTHIDTAQLIDSLYSLSRTGNPMTQLATQTSLLLFGSDRTATSLHVDHAALAEALVSLNVAAATPVNNSSLSLKDGELQVKPSSPGDHLDVGLSTLRAAEQLGQLKKQVVLPMVTVLPELDSSRLTQELPRVRAYISKPIAVVADTKSWQLPLETVVGWLNVSSAQKPYKTDLLNNFYRQRFDTASLGFDKNQVSAYVNQLGSEVNQDAVDAQLTITDGKAAVFKQSRDGKVLDAERSVAILLQALTEPRTDEPIKLAVVIKKADVSDDNIEKLGIKELISEGVTYFPGSPPNRLQNVRVGAARYNGVLIKPGQVFSFGEHLGPVGPEQGYTPGLIILGDHEEMAYGGGLCQVSSTAFRAALLAGLPILERLNHAFAISYYTAPYGVPGVDATIFYPEVDMKFKNDTPNHILIQTSMVGTTLKFSYYGTKQKAGVIRGPFFISGNHDETKPSQTVFYRDVTDLSGKVIKTDTFNTYYKSSLDFPITG